MFINNISCYIMNDLEDLEFGGPLLRDPPPPGTPTHTPSYIGNTPPGTPKTRLPIAKMTAADKKERRQLEKLISKGTKNNYGAMGRPLGPPPKGGKRKTRRAKKSKRKSKKSKRKSKKSKRKSKKSKRK
jgi:hypothetical protein